MSAHFSPIMMQAALVLPETTVGMIEASATRKPARPCTLRLVVDHRHRVARRAHRAGAARVEDRAAAGAGVGQHVVVADPRRPGLDLLGDVGLERRGPAEPAGELQAVDDAAPVGLGGEVVGGDRRLVGRGPPSAAAPCRGSRGRSWQTEAVKPENRCSGSPGRSAENSMMWNWMSGVASSGRVRAKIAPWPAPTVSGPVRNRAATPAPSALLEGAVDAVVERDRLGAAIDRARLEVVLQIVPDARQVVHHLDAVLPQMLGRADARQLEELRRVDRAGRRARSRAPPARPARRRSGGSARRSRAGPRR